MVDLQVNDPVHVVSGHGSSSNTAPLEGVVCFIGTVEGLGEGGIMIGVRLTGASAGQGASTGGTHDGKKYFNCPPSSGLFCTPDQVTKRNLTRLEELRLRRELSSTAAATASSAAGPPSTPPRGGTATAAASSKSGLKTPSPSSALRSAAGGRSTTGISSPSSGSSKTTAGAISPTTTTTTTATRSKLDELRARRAALQKKDTTSTAATSSPRASVAAAAPHRSSPSKSSAAAVPSAIISSPPRAAASSAAGASTSTAVVQELQSQLTEKTNQMQQLQKSLEQAQQQAQQDGERISKLEKDLIIAAKNNSSTSSSSNSNQADTSSSSDKQQQQDLLLVEQQQSAQLQRDLEQEQDAHAETQKLLKEADEKAARLQQQQTQQQQSQTQQPWNSQQANEAYKERARLQAEVAALHRAASAWAEERIQLESTLEDVTLDKEQYREEKEALEDRLEESKLDVETAQMEVEELRLQVEDVRYTAEQSHAAAALASATGNLGEEQEGKDATTTPTDDVAEEKIRALSVQNGRLREALIRLREQTALEKMQLTKDLRTAEKESEASQAIQAENAQLKLAKTTLEEQVNDLKDMVEQGAAFEGMVEDLSDRVMTYEEEFRTLQTTIREMEEAAELTAEMEEVQTEELKAMWRDMEGRDSIIRNLEEAIKMQRRREDDYRRTVGNYRTTVDTLRQEKQALLELQQGEHGEKTTWMAASQKALARAAQLVTDAAALRKREARAAMVSMESQVYKHLSVRLERLLPKTPAASSEISAVKGELVTAKVAGKASKTLEGIAESFTKNIKPPLPPDEVTTKAGADTTSTEGDDDGEETAAAPPPWELSDEVKQEVTTMLHQTEFSHVLIDASAELRRLLCAGQWPELVTPDVSLELGSILGHGIGELDSMLTVTLKSLKEEGTLTQEQSNIGALRQTIQTTMQALRADIEREDSTLVPASWNPAGWQLLKDASMARFSCMGSAAALSSALHSNDMEQQGAQPPAKLFALYNKLEQASTQATSVCLRLANLDVQNTQLVSSLSACIVQWNKDASEVMDCMSKLVLSSSSSSSTENIEACEQAVAKTLKALAVLLHSLRGAGLNPTEDERVHALSPEADDAWERLTDIVRSIRGIDGDEEEVNYLIRAHDIEMALQQAVENQPKLAQAEAKVASLEKTLSSRSKEIAMQNAKMSELEKHLAKSSTGALGRGPTSDLKSVEEYNNLKEENRVLTEAVDVMQRQVDDYENEIRALKDFKSPKRGGRGTPRRALTSIGAMGDLSSPQLNRGGAVDEATLSNVGALEATLFRPALQAALRDVARWKSAATVQSIMQLPPLPSFEESKNDEARDDLMQLESALSSYRLEKASATLVDLNHPTKSPREQLRELKARDRIASENLETVVLRCRGRLYG